MKIQTRAALKYARALFAAAEAQNLLDRAHADLGEVVKVARADPDFLVVMNQPRIALQRKKQLIERLFSGTLHGLLFDFLQLLVDKRRFGVIEAIHKEFGNLLEEYRRILPAEATTAVALDADQQERLRQKLNQVTGFKVQLIAKVDPAILGGLSIRMRDQLIDGSVATQLRRMREQLKQTRVGGAIE